ncbi:MAG TPA: hypothetical protein VGA19_07475 [Rhodospirillales bacterium]
MPGLLLASLPRAVAWRVAVVALIPIAVWAADVILYRYTPDRVGDVVYEVRTNKWTGRACLKFRDAPPKGLRDLAC